jgi:hypothetical protein
MSQAGASLPTLTASMQLTSLATLAFLAIMQPLVHAICYLRTVWQQTNRVTVCLAIKTTIYSWSGATQSTRISATALHTINILHRRSALSVGLAILWLWESVS